MSMLAAIRVAPWPTDEQAVRAVRHAVFTAEQGIDAGVFVANCALAPALARARTAPGCGHHRVEG